MKIFTKRRGLAAAAAAAVTVGVLAAVAPSGAHATTAKGAAYTNSGAATGLGQLSGLLPTSKLTEESAIQVNLSNESVRLPLYPGIAYKGTPKQEKVWYILLDASDSGLAHDLGVNYAPKLANIAISDPAAVQTVTLTNPTPQANPFGPGVINFAGAPASAPLASRHPARTASRWPSSPPAPWPAPGTARSSRSQAPKSSTTRRSWPPATARST
jgi:hypothetical protein